MNCESEPILPRVRRDLRENILPFWAEHSWDKTFGGFVGHLGDHGQWLGVTDKHIRIQTRMIWTLSAAHRHGLTSQGYLELAGKGFRFLVDRMWDKEHEGFFTAIRADGTPLLSWKWVYAHSFVIYALSEYFMATGDEEALLWARKTMAVIERHARGPNGGYLEFFSPDWGPRLRRQRQYTLDNHLHLMEGANNLHRAKPADATDRMIRDLVGLLSGPMLLDDSHGVDRYSLDWRPKRSIDLQVTTSLGHNVELAWLLADACSVVDEPIEGHLPTIRALADYVLEFGFDQENGGIGFYSLPGRHVTESRLLRKRRLLRGWWQQAEMLNGLICCYELTRDSKYLAAFSKQFEWVWRRQIDHEGGEWHAWLTWPEGTPLRHPKGNEHKCCYHNARAWMICEKALERLGLRGAV